MPNITAVLNEQIRRLARREIRANTRNIKRSTAHYRRDIAALKRQLSDVLKQLNRLRKQTPMAAGAAVAAEPELLQRSRLRIDGLKAHRSRLGLSAQQYGQLLGVSPLTVYAWENGKTRPRRSHLPQIVAVRGIGKREALQRLGIIAAPAVAVAPVAKSGPRRLRKRGIFKRTGEQSLLAWIGGKSLTTKELNRAWKEEGRGGSADVMLGKLVKSKKLKRTKKEGLQGSIYSLA